ncbi:MAG: DnaA regulatory inactivator Hda [Gammaproteobacteria bacterium]|nr:DnaA regulatory inactivator Hda [Gammaproteobacteria bacterium]
MSAADHQLTLDLYNVTRHELDDFQRAGNAETVAAIERLCRGEGPRVVYLWGASGSGKSHLLQAAVQAVGVAGERAMYLPLRALAASGPAVLEGLEAVALLAIDDLDSVAAEPAWAEQLFHLYNALAAADGRLLWSSRSGPATTAFGLPDLASRAAASLVYQLHEPDEGAKAAILVRLAARRGFDLPPPVVEFILRRERRDLVSLVALLDVLDRASLSHGRVLTVPFVRELLAARG